MQFKYKVFTQNSKVQEGMLDGASKDEVIRRLQQDQNIIISVEESQADINQTFWEKWQDQIKEKDIVIASKQLATLFSAGVQALRCFRLLSTESSSRAINKRFFIIANDIQSGMPIYKAMERHPEVFNTFYVSMVHSGEESGKLTDVLEYLASYLERNYEITQKTKKALTYPAFVVATFIGVMIIMTVFVLPKLANLLLEQGRELPIFTKVMISISNVIINFWWALIPGIFATFYYLFAYAKTVNGKAYFDQIKLKIPLLKHLYEKLYLSRMADNINTMLLSGVPIVQALQITSEVVDNYVFKKTLERVAEKVKNGKLLSLAFSEEPNIPNIMIQMTRIGEETGELGYMLANMSKFYKKELEQTIDNVLALIEPVMIVVMGGAVGLLLGSVLLPMYDVATNIQ